MLHFRNRSRLEAFTWIVAFPIISCFAVALSAHETLDAFLRSYEEFQLDEVSMAFSVAGTLGLAYSVFEYCKMQEKLVKAIIARRTSLGMKITAEGVEQEASSGNSRRSDGMSAKLICPENPRPRKLYRRLESSTSPVIIEICFAEHGRHCQCSDFSRSP